MVAFALTNQEKQLRAQLKAVHDRINARVGVFAKTPAVSPAQNDQDHADMEQLGRALYQSLVQRSLVPTFSATLIANRGMQPYEPDFFAHLHSVEDLLAQLNP